MHEANGTPSLFRSLHHISLVVENLDDIVTKLERLGFGPFASYPPLTDYVQLNVRDAEGFYELRMKVCDLGAITLQIIEAKGSNTIYEEFLTSRGQGIFHLGFQVDDIRAAERASSGLGLRVVSSGRRADGSGFAYLDTEAELGVTLLVRQSPTSALAKSR